MTLGETAKLIIQLDLVGNAAAEIKKVSKSLGDLDKAASGRISGGLKNLGTGLGVAFVRGATIAVGAIGGITTAIGLMVREGQEAAKSHLLFTNAIANSGKVSTQYVTILKAQQLELLNLAGVDDELIAAEQTKLIQMGLTGEAVAKLTPLILDMANATGIDLLTATLAVGKATNGSAQSLQRYGVFVDKARFKVDPLAAVMEALNKKFGGTTKALSGTLETKLKVLNEGLANIREEAGIRLLPALTHLIDVAGTRLVPAFGKFIDRVMPALIKGINDFADLLESGGVERGIDAITNSIGPMVKVLQMAVGPVKAIVSAFLKLPQQVQAALISGVVINKLSGGLVAAGAKDIVGGAASLAGPSVGAAFTALLQKVGLMRGSTPATPLFVMDVQNRLPNGQFAPGVTQQPTALATVLKTAMQVAIPLVLAEIVGGAIVDATGGPVAGTADAGTGRVIAELGGVKIAIGQSQAAIVRAVNALPVELKNALGGILYQGGGRSAKDDTINPKTNRPRDLTLVQLTQNKRGFAGGSYDVPTDMTAGIHKGEMIIPRNLASVIRQQLALTRLRRLHNTSNPLSSLSRPSGPQYGDDDWVSTSTRPRFRPSARLDPSQIIDRRPVVAVVSTRDVKSAGIIKRRAGPTAAEAGAM